MTERAQRRFPLFPHEESKLSAAAESARRHARGLVTAEEIEKTMAWLFPEKPKPRPRAPEPPAPLPDGHFGTEHEGTDDR